MAEWAVRSELMVLQSKYISFSLDMHSPNREFNLRITDMMISITEIPDDVGSQMFKSISNGIDEESLNFEVVPSFLFEEKEDSINSERKSLTIRSNSIDVLHFQSEGVESKVIRNFNNRNKSTIDEQCYEHLKELFILNKKLNYMDCLFLQPYVTRLLFDRGFSEWMLSCLIQCLHL
ncbi:hypothetical protein MKW98_029293 [Papaver atlanticum]|uniref:Uncharacterized protein n=1 Tax=Papaver atlanticum TaxID=357466 RepID=A0AAD4XGC1_9MAGN|nr:hypothetical protein MKW98_029293 [Papaver atlanticum]